MESSSYKVVLKSDAAHDDSSYVQHYGVKGMRWGVINEEKPIGPTRGPVIPYTASSAPKPKIASQPQISGHRYQDLLKQMNARSTNNQKPNQSELSDPSLGFIKMFTPSPRKDIPLRAYAPTEKAESVPGSWELWSQIPGLDLNNPEDQKYGGYIGRYVGAAVDSLKAAGIFGIPDITDPMLKAYDIDHYKKELDGMISESFKGSQVAQRLGFDRYRQDFLLDLKRKGFDFFTPEEKFMHRNIGFYPTPMEKLKWEEKLKESSRKADQILRNQRTTGTASRIGRDEDGSQRSSSRRNPYGATPAIVVSKEYQDDVAFNSQKNGPTRSTPSQKPDKKSNSDTTWTTIGKFGDPTLSAIAEDWIKRQLRQ